MARNAINGNIARYSATPPQLRDGAAVSLQVDSSGALHTGTVLPGSPGFASKNKVNGQPARYNSDLLQLEDGEACALQVDEHGDLIVKVI